MAQTAQPAGPGALAGRSPVQAYRTAEAGTTCKAAMHSLPAGKLPTYGTHALPNAGADCARSQVASADAKRTVARD